MKKLKMKEKSEMFILVQKWDNNYHAERNWIDFRNISSPKWSFRVEMDFMSE